MSWKYHGTTFWSGAEVRTEKTEDKTPVFRVTLTEVAESAMTEAEAKQRLAIRLQRIVQELLKP